MQKLMQAEFQRMMQNEWKQKVRSFSDLNKFAQKGKIVLTGSSLCEQFPVNEMLMSLGSKAVVYNRGIGGDIISGLKKRMNESIFDLEPAKLFINIGTNDISAENYSREKLFEEYRDVLEEVKAKLPECRIYILAYYPVNRNLSWFTDADRERVNNGFRARTNEELITVNSMLRDMAKELDCEFIDVFTCLLDETGNMKEEYCKDGMHIYPEGYMEVLKVLMPYFE
ncbi:MAG: GDSL-type esterase/lipase family protein [Clostridia bacterium]|nr:GDSL-type esterase/lipase family protein [Clostridia bacterium]